MTPEERLFAEYEKCRVMLVGFNPPEVKQLKGRFFEKRNKNPTEIRDAASALQKAHPTIKKPPETTVM